MLYKVPEANSVVWISRPELGFNAWLCVFIFLFMYIYLSILTPLEALINWNTRNQRTTHGLPWYALGRTRISNSPISSSIPSIRPIPSDYSDSVFTPRNRMWTVVWSCMTMIASRWRWMKLVRPCLLRTSGSIYCLNWNPVVCSVCLWMCFGGMFYCLLILSA